MYAIIQTGGKQYKVSPGDVLDVETLDVDDSDVVRFDQVLAIGEGADVNIGTPNIAGASVSGELVEQRRGKKVIAFKMKRRKGYKRKKGHRQNLSRILIVEITKSGDSSSRVADEDTEPAAEE
mgnify:FL=1|jgi:large subunit ribosomal protein L21